MLPFGRNAAKAAPEIYKVLNPKAGNLSIAAAPAVISTKGRDLKRIPDRSLALLEMTERVASIIPLLGGVRCGFIL